MHLSRLKTLGIIGTVLDGLAALVGLVAAIELFLLSYRIGALPGQWMNDATNVDPESIVAGYEVLAKVFGAGLGVLGLLVVYLLVLLSAGLTVWLLITVITGIVTQVRLKKGSLKDPVRLVRAFRIDAVVRIIINLVTCVTLGFGLPNNDGVTIASVCGALYFGGIAVLGWFEYRETKL